jgi:hypothetical protein
VDARAGEACPTTEEDLGLLKPDNITHDTASVDEFPRMRENSVLAPAPAVVTVKPDPKWPNMYRVHLPNGKVSDMTKLTRANDAARSLSRSG